MSNQVPNKNKLTPKERIFCNIYFSNNFNGIEAAKEAGYSEKSAAGIASNILKRDRVQEYLQELENSKSRTAVLTKEWVLAEAVDLYLLAKQEKAFAPASRLLGMMGAEVGVLQENKQINQTVTVEHMLGNIPKGIETPLKQIN